jgi:hypothetical protein
LEAKLSTIATDKLPGIVKLLDERRARTVALVGELVVGLCSMIPSHSSFPPVELGKELHGIQVGSARVSVDNLEAAMAQFTNHTLRGKGQPLPDDWKVGHAAMPLGDHASFHFCSHALYTVPYLRRLTMLS